METPEIKETNEPMKNEIKVGDLYSYKQPDETKQFDFIIKEQHLDEVNKTATIEGYGAIFGNVDLGNDMITRGAFSKTLKDKGNKVYFLADHKYDTDHVLGVATVEEDDVGLLGKFEINLETQRGKEAYAQAKQMHRHGIPLGLSIGFDIMEDGTDQKTQVRLLKQIRLHEISLTPFPMNQEARVTSAKAQNKELAIMQEILDSLKSMKPFKDTSTNEPTPFDKIETIIKSLQNERN